MPNFLPSRYDILSATTGVEVIQIPETFSSPVRVGVFASAQYVNTSYSLLISSGLSLLAVQKLAQSIFFDFLTTTFRPLLCKVLQYHSNNWCIQPISCMKRLNLMKIELLIKAGKGLTCAQKAISFFWMKTVRSNSCFFTISKNAPSQAKVMTDQRSAPIMW